MAKVVQAYLAKFLDVNITCDYDGMVEFCAGLKGELGALLIYVSQKKKPGALFVVFECDKGALQTSLGELYFNDNGELFVTTQQEQNNYTFKLLDIEDEQQFLHDILFITYFS